MQRRRLLTTLKVVAQIAAVAFVVWTASKVAREWNGLPAGVPVVALLWAGLASFVALFVQAYAWQAQIEHLSLVRLGWALQLRVFMASNLGRYLPGKVGLPAIRIAALAGHGLGPALVGSAVLLEAFCWLATAGCLAFAIVAFAPSLPLPAALARAWPSMPALAAFLSLALGLLVLALALVDRRHLPAALLRLSGLHGQGPLIALRLPLGQLLYWGAWWLHGFLLVSGFGVPRGEAAVAGAAFILGPVIGFFALITPAGAGVREAVVIALVSPFAGMSNSVAIGLLSRLLSLASDVLAWLVSLALARRYAGLGGIGGVGALGRRG